ncbi:MAG: hypothetical protein AB7Y74_00835 [Syntrophorhabdus sp.]
MFDKFLLFLNTNNGVIQFLSLVLWGTYVYFTIKTFCQIKEQTDLQSNALLYIELLDQAKTSGGSINKIDDSISEESERWVKIIVNNLPDAITEDRPLMFKLKNKGKSDIVWWKIHLKAEINPRDHLKQLNIHGREMEWYVESRNAKEVIGINEEIILVIMNIGNIPDLSLAWSVEYKDSRRKVYQDFYGDMIFKDINALT